LDGFERGVDELRKQIVARKVRWQAAQRLELAEVINSQELENLASRRFTRPPANLKGDPVAAGVFTGIARILLDPKETRDIGVNYVLVCPQTDPAGRRSSSMRAG